MNSKTLFKNILTFIASISFLFFSNTLAQEAGQKPVNIKEIRPSGENITADVTGITGDALENVGTRLKINLRPVNEAATIGDIQNFYKKAPEEITEALKPFGYFHPKITSRLTHEGHYWKAAFDIDPGDAIEITDIQLVLTGEGAEDKKFQTLRLDLIKKIRGTLNVKHYEDAKQDLYDLAEKRGYFNAKIVNSKMAIDLANYKATLYIHFDTGPRYKFGAISFTPSPLADSFLQRFAPFKPGEPFSESKLERFQQNLSNSNYFQKILVERQPGNDKEAPIKVKLKAKKARQYILGVGWASDTGARGLFGVNFRRLNPQGHHLKIDTDIAQYKRIGRATYTIPGRNPATDQYNIIGTLERIDERPGIGNNEKLELNYVTAFQKWRPTFALIVLDEKFTLRDQPRKSDQMLIPSFSIARARSDDPLKPTKGYKISFNVRGASHRILAKNSFLQARVDLKGLYSLTDSKRIVLRGSIAKTQINNIYNLPLSLQYYAGGPYTVRGYRYLDIGPGKAFMVASAEFQQRIKGNLFLALFYDIGNVSPQFFKHVKRSPGVGFVYLSPIGDIELDIATALDNNRPNYKRGYVRLQFNIGMDIFSISSKE